jgi:hypothetical protein
MTSGTHALRLPASMPDTIAVRSKDLQRENETAWLDEGANQGMVKTPQKSVSRNTGCWRVTLPPTTA